MKKLITLIAFLYILCSYNLNCHGESNQEYINSAYNYSISLPVGIEVLKTNVQDGTVTLGDADNAFTVSITCDRLDTNSLLIMREYLNDYDSPDQKIFERFIDYKKSYFYAVKDSYEKAFLFSGEDSPYMKVFKEYTEKVFGQDSDITLYNVTNQSNEESHINISVPVGLNKTIYSINFISSRGSLTKTVLEKMSTLVSSIRIADLPQQSDMLSVFTDQAAVDAANLGVYPDVDSVSYSEFVNTNSGYKISYPSAFIPYIQNNIIDSFDYRSFKIDNISFFSITTEPLTQSLNLKLSELENIRLGDKDFSYIKYDGIQEYYITCNSRFYTIQLNSQKSSDKLQYEFIKILSSMQFTTPRTLDHSLPMINVKKDGYTFSYPKDWKLIEDNPTTFRIVNPDLSGPLNVYITEDSQNYTPPYLDKSSKLLASRRYTKGNAVYIHKLVNYLDTDGRGKLCYSTDIIQGQKMYSLFISVSDYLTEGGKISSSSLNDAVNAISSSFMLESAVDDSIKNRCKRFFENYLLTDVNLSFYLPDELSSTNNRLGVYVDSNYSSGFFVVEVDPMSIVSYSPTIINTKGLR